MACYEHVHLCAESSDGHPFGSLALLAAPARIPPMLSEGRRFPDPPLFPSLAQALASSPTAALPQSFSRALQMRTATMLLAALPAAAALNARGVAPLRMAAARAGAVTMSDPADFTLAVLGDLHVRARPLATSANA